MTCSRSTRRPQTLHTAANASKLLPVDAGALTTGLARVQAASACLSGELTAVTGQRDALQAQADALARCQPKSAGLLVSS
jgi:hypothetical protein